jgi:hypothetical protein
VEASESPFSPLPAEAEGLPLVAASSLPNPFAEDVCSGPYAVEETRSVPGMNVDVLRQLTSSIDERLGGFGGGQPLLLLTAPRAGYGKTHLLGRLASAAGGQIVLVPLAFRMEDPISLVSVAKRGLESMARAETGRPGWTRLREACAGVCANLVRQLIGSGQLPCANPDQAQRVLSGNPVEIFDPAGSARLIGEWLRRHGSALTKPLTHQAAQKVAATPAVIEMWLNAMLHHAQEGSAASSVPLMALAADEDQDGAVTFLRVLGLWRPVVVMVDHLDAYYRNPDAGLKIAALLLDMAEMDGVHVVMSLNQDVWQATFGHHLPSAMEDRLTSSQLLLRGLTEADAADLLRMRLDIADVTPEQRYEFEVFVDVKRYFLGRPLGSVSARGFLRHLARQWEVFLNTPPSPAEAFGGGLVEDNENVETSFEAVESLPLVIPAISEPPPMPELPADPAQIFDSGTVEHARTIAEGLAEPVAALPQENEPSPPTPEMSAQATGAFEKLREMLGKLRHPAMPSTSPPPPHVPQPVLAPESAPPPPLSTAPPPLPTAPPAAEAEREVLRGRYEALRLQMSAEAESLPLDHAKVGELIRLAGRRFPLVRFSEHELPGMAGRQVMGWSLQGLEILFGMASFADAAYWRTLSSFAAGKAAETSAAAQALGDAMPKVKLVTFKMDREQQSWSILRMSDAFPAIVEPMLDAIHLDPTSVASLYAMQRIIKESECGALQATPAQVMSVLARELDFFWRRVTRVS